MKGRGIAAKLDAAGTKLNKIISWLSDEGMRQLFSRINQLSIKKEVDAHGLDSFINRCALMAAGSGIITGVGGITTMAIGVPLDMINLLAQQFRVTLGIAYKATGSYKIEFDDFIVLVAATLKIDAQMAITKNVLEEVAEKLILNAGSKTARRLVPIVGAVIGGSVNYLFIKRMAGNALKSQAVALPVAE